MALTGKTEYAFLAACKNCGFPGPRLSSPGAKKVPVRPTTIKLRYTE